MISISGIKYQKELEAIPYFNKKQAGILIGKKGRNLDDKIFRLKKINYLLNLKKGLYTTSPYYDTTDKSFYCEYIANILRIPSYISLEYVLAKYNLIPEGVYPISSITYKSSRSYTNFLGSFSYQNIKRKLFSGFEERKYRTVKIYIAGIAKALFDYLYLKKLNNLKQEIITDLRINWAEFKKEDLIKFEQYTKISKSKKMETVLKIIKKNINVN